jgi:hydroxymethylglutaryl-CoA reductase
MSEKSSRIPKFYQLGIEERLKIVSEFAGLTEEEREMLLRGGLDLATANRMIENVIGIFQLPLGIAVNFLIDGKDYLIPMAIEEPSVVAAASNAARWARGRRRNRDLVIRTNNDRPDTASGCEKPIRGQVRDN